MRRHLPLSVAIFLACVGSEASHAQLCFTDCVYVCDSESSCTKTCTDNCNQPSTCGEYGACNTDPDGDGVFYYADNCEGLYNPDQANCDGDAAGDVCDSLNASYYPLAGSEPCHIVGRTHVGYFDVSLHTEAPIRDGSYCGAPDGWAHYSGPTLGCNWLQAKSLLSCCDKRFGFVLCTQYLNNDRCHPAILNF